MNGPTIGSELTFNKSTTLASQFRGRWRRDDETWGVVLDITGGQFTHGTVRDDGFAADNRQGLRSRSLSQISGNAILGAGIDVEYRLVHGKMLDYTRAGSGSAWLQAGFRFNQQTYRIVQGVQVVPATGPLDLRLDSSYRARWMGPEVGLRTELSPLPTDVIEVRGQVAWWPSLLYNGRGFWNLRSDLAQTPSFEHAAKGWGVGTDLQGCYRFGEDGRGSVGLGWQWQWMQTGGGKNRLYHADGSVTETSFNGAARQGQFYYLSVGWRF